MSAEIIGAGGGVISRVHESDNGLTFETIQDAEPIMDGCHARRVHGVTGSSEVRHAASLPVTAVENYCSRLGITFREFLGNPEHARAMCNDPALKAFRVWEGKV